MIICQGLDQPLVFPFSVCQSFVLSFLEILKYPYQIMYIIEQILIISCICCLISWDPCYCCATHTEKRKTPPIFVKKIYSSSLRELNSIFMHVHSLVLGMSFFFFISSLFESWAPILFPGIFHFFLFLGASHKCPGGLWLGMKQFCPMGVQYIVVTANDVLGIHQSWVSFSDPLRHQFFNHFEQVSTPWASYV